MTGLFKKVPITIFFSDRTHKVVLEAIQDLKGMEGAQDFSDAAVIHYRMERSEEEDVRPGDIVVDGHHFLATDIEMATETMFGEEKKTHISHFDYDGGCLRHAEAILVRETLDGKLTELQIVESTFLCGILLINALCDFEFKNGVEPIHTSDCYRSLVGEDLTQLVKRM